MKILVITNHVAYESTIEGVYPFDNSLVKNFTFHMEGDEWNKMSLWEGDEFLWSLTKRSFFVSLPDGHLEVFPNQKILELIKENLLGLSEIAEIAEEWLKTTSIDVSSIPLKKPRRGVIIRNGVAQYYY